MINYTISYNNPHRHYVDFELFTTTNGKESMRFQLAAWRPGRYELADFAQNIQKWAAFDENNNPLPFKKITKDLWEVTTEGVIEVTINYNFYANQLDAGACYLDENQLYLNPVHCMFYIDGRMKEDYIIELDGASNRGIDEIRDLKESIQYVPVEGKYKIFIIDEAHMLTKEAFNALLKTLEEPPAHAIFILATTENQKIPSTISSRCQQYEFKRIY